MYNLRYCEFYITNVCNLNCENCNRFNNFAFTGHQNWHAHADDYAQWADLIKFDTIGIIGGEPLLNPTFIDWLNGIAHLWPDSKINVITNGTQLHRWPELYSAVEKLKDQVTITVSIHGLNLKEKIYQDVYKWLQGPITERYLTEVVDPGLWKKSYDVIRDPSWPDCNTPEEFVNLPEAIQRECKEEHQVSLEKWQTEIYPVQLIDANGVKVELSMSHYFNESTVRFDPLTKELTLHNSDPVKALEVCYSKTCHHFIEGKLYKCGPVGVLPNFIKEFPVVLSDKDRELINSYIPAEYNWSSDSMDQFIKNLVDKTVIPQCKFCPATMDAKQFEAGTKKVKIIKLKQVSTH
jgi:hypothetical protein